jgi:Sulfotransferase domain
MWTVPRSVSTSFERMMSARRDHVVFDEPFSRSYYYGPDRLSPRYSETLPDSSAEQVLAALEHAAEERPVFVKDMAYHAAGTLSSDVLSRFENCFLVRDPAATLRSLARRWPDFTDDEAGWRHLDTAARITESLGQGGPVIDADLLCRDPADVVAEWCRRMDLPYDPAALTWDPGMRAEWELWGDWHASTARSTGFTVLDEPPPPPAPDEPRLHKAYQEALPVYRRLAAKAIGGSASVGGVTP